MRTTHASGPIIIVIEAGLAALALAVLFGWPRLAFSSFSRLELLPLFPIYLPFIPGEFGFLLAAGKVLFRGNALPLASIGSIIELSGWRCQYVLPRRYNGGVMGSMVENLLRRIMRALTDAVK